MNCICIVTRTKDYLEHAERMNRNHKWIDRKRGPNGKWIYDYGNGFPGEKRKRSYADVRPDSGDFVRVNGQKVFKAEDDTAFIRNRYNKFKGMTRGRNAVDASRNYNESRQKNQHSIKYNGRRYVY